ncbi:hypothetical protein A6A11_03420 [Bisgaardia hudsonensis]|nr:hypothetical protein A6A11_03420 [Bisgaardia hudsonensis]
MRSLKLIVRAFYEEKDFLNCIRVGKEYIKRNQNDYFIYEILGESYRQQNNLVQAFESYSMALSINDRLVAAKFKYLILKYRLHLNLNEDEILEMENIAIKAKNSYRLRLVSYIQFSEGLLQESKNNLIRVLSLENGLQSLDYLTLSLIEKYLGNIDESEKYNQLFVKSSFKLNFESINSKSLLITLSPGNDFVLQKYKMFEADMLNIVDTSTTYYILSADPIVSHIEKMVKKYSYTQISIVGSSKAGTGVVYLMDMLHKKYPNIRIKGVACSPQIQLYPFNSNLIIPSYKRLSEYIFCNKELQNKLKRLVEINELPLNDNCSLTIFYGKNFKIDFNEIRLVNKRKYLNIIELDYSGHASLIPITIPEGETKEELKVKYADLPIDSDLKVLGGDDLVDIVDEIYEIYKDPQMRLYKYL